MARSKLTPELQAKVVEYIQEGNYDKVAAQAVGITRATFYRWIRLGRKEQSGPHYEFYLAVEKAKALGEVALLQTIKRASARTWQAAAWILERSRPERYSLYRAKQKALDSYKTDILDMLKKGDITTEDVIETMGEELAYELFDEAGISVARPGETEEESSVQEQRETAEVPE
ncbi:MAG: helix-turn-helix domain-containing protein [Candidatus Thorarchaeota archaeon]|jgi:transposase